MINFLKLCRNIYFAVGTIALGSLLMETADLPRGRALVEYWPGWALVVVFIAVGFILQAMLEDPDVAPSHPVAMAGLFAVFVGFGAAGAVVTASMHVPLIELLPFCYLSFGCVLGGGLVAWSVSK